MVRIYYQSYCRIEEFVIFLAPLRFLLFKPIQSRIYGKIMFLELLIGNFSTQKVMQFLWYFILTLSEFGEDVLNSLSIIRPRL